MVEVVQDRLRTRGALEIAVRMIANLADTVDHGLSEGPWQVLAGAGATVEDRFILGRSSPQPGAPLLDPTP